MQISRRTSLEQKAPREIAAYIYTSFNPHQIKSGILLNRVPRPSYTNNHLSTRNFCQLLSTDFITISTHLFIWNIKIYVISFYIHVLKFSLIWGGKFKKFFDKIHKLKEKFILRHYLDHHKGNINLNSKQKIKHKFSFDQQILFL